MGARPWAPSSKIQVSEIWRRLPAAVPVSPITPITIPAATPSSASASSTESPASASASATPTACRRSRLVNDDLAAHEVLAVESLNGALGLLVVIYLDEPEPAWLTRKTVAHQGHVRHGDSRLREKTAELLFRSLKRQVAHVKFLQRKTPSGRGEADPRDRGLKTARSRLGDLGEDPGQSTRVVPQHRGASCSKFASTSTTNLNWLLYSYHNLQLRLRHRFASKSAASHCGDW